MPVDPGSKHGARLVVKNMAFTMVRNLHRDTDPRIEKLQIGLIRDAPVYKRLQVVSSLVKTMRRLSWQGLCERYSEESMEARIERFFSLLYGDLPLAQKAIRASKKRPAQL